MALPLRSALSAFDAATRLGTASRLAAGTLLAETVREELKDTDDDELDLQYPATFSVSPLTTRRLPIAITDHREFVFEGVMYPTVQHAFQSQKLPEDKREDASVLSLGEVLKRGRDAELDIAAWDANKNKLMLKLIHEQAKQNEDMCTSLIKYKDQRSGAGRERPARSVLAGYAACHLPRSGAHAAQSHQAPCQ